MERLFSYGVRGKDISSFKEKISRRADGIEIRQFVGAAGGNDIVRSVHRRARQYCHQKPF